MSIFVIDKNKCVSCMACYSACPVKAIEIKTDENGFYFPFINEEKCTKCGQCTSICPACNEKNRCFNEKLQNPEIYACTNADENIRQNSSSGGMFTVLADYVLESGGYVCGCILDDDLKAVHIVSNNSNDIEKMRGSKYIQSYIGDCYKKIKELLNSDKTVLFTGTPCQVAGLNAYLGEKYDNLITLDVICSCVNPPYLLKEYLQNEIKDGYQKILKVNFRDKITGWGGNDWGNFAFSTEWLDKAKNLRKFYEHNLENLFFKGFLSHLWMNECCNNCAFGIKNRNSDITLGDFWCINRYNKELNDNKGLSFVMLNSKKSKQIFENIKFGLDICEKIDYDWAIETQPVLNGTGMYKHKNRDLFFKYAPNHYSTMELTKDLLGINKVGILTYDFSINYGAHLQTWALCKRIEYLGFTPKIIRWANHYQNTLGYEDDNLKPFRDKYLPRTAALYTEDELEAETWDCNRIIIGGDQVFRNWKTESSLPVTRYFGDFVFGNKVLAGFGASFGLDFFNGNDYLVNEGKKLFKRFDKIAVREQSGVDILEKTFDVDGIEVLDPVFLQNESDYTKLIADAQNIYTPDFKYIAYMVLGGQVGFSDLNKNLCSNLKDNHIININADETGNFNTIEQWLNYIKNAEFIITDSFHCVCFAIIFKKPFIVVNRTFGGTTRIENLLSKFKLNTRYKDTLDEIHSSDLLESTDWDAVYKILQDEKQKSINYLLSILLLKPNYKPKYINEELSIIRKYFEDDYKRKKENQKNEWLNHINDKLIEQEKINNDFAKSLDLIWLKSDDLKSNLENLTANNQNPSQILINKEFSESFKLIWEKTSTLQETINKLYTEFKTSKYNRRNKTKFLEQIFSVKNEYSENKKHKVVNILGLKMKFMQRSIKIEK